MKNKELKKLHRIKYQKLRQEVLPNLEIKIINHVKDILRAKLVTNKLNGYLGIYWPLKGEVDLRSLKTLMDIPLAIPASQKGGGLTYHAWSNASLSEDIYGIPSALNEPSLQPEDIDLLLIPALAIDQQGVRLGYGGGFFDRLRTNGAWRSIPALVVLPKNCISKEPLPRDSWDIPFDGWISEDGEHLIQGKQCREVGPSN